MLPPVLIFHSVLLMSTLKFGHGITAGNFVNTHIQRHGDSFALLLIK